MKIYIPSHLRKIGLIDMMYQMISHYTTLLESSEDSFDDYHYILKIDPVRKFLNLVYPNSWPEEIKEETITYLSSMFYSVKGTFKVLDYLVNYGILSGWTNKDVTSQISYSSRKVSISIALVTQDEKLFCEYLEQFLCALLYFDELEISIEKIETEVNDRSTTSINHKASFYQYYEASY